MFLVVYKVRIDKSGFSDNYTAAVHKPCFQLITVLSN